MSTLDISVIIPTHNRCREVVELLTDIRNSCVDGIRIEVIVVASNCADNTVKECSSLLKNMGVIGKVKEVVEPGVAKAKNAGLQEAVSDIALFLDDDMVVPNNYFQEYAKGIEEFPDASVYGGRIVARWPSGKPWWYPAEESRRVDGVVGNFDPLPRSGYVMQPPFGGNMAIKIDALKELRFNSDLGMNKVAMGFGEESALVKELQGRVCRVAYLREAVVYHKLQPKFCRLGYILKRLYKLNKALVALGFVPGTSVESSRKKEAVHLVATFSKALVGSVRERDTKKIFQWVETVARRETDSGNWSPKVRV